MQSETFRKWLLERGCHFDRTPRGRAKHLSQATVAVRREGRVSALPLVGSRKRLPDDVVQSIVEQLGLDPAELPGPKSRV
ncbi:hypothetical protein [Dongia sedimenti]|uniref:Type II toxin-antitoxin system HicA family toxin n=1 Tax=Dongia sedimenti TaxID=3064282 RepID=A0ABU0YS05_9PROT|nr:hypothetical protein [Rhodospirillaceae bacterium R-7]